jgi:hypothetical protein
VLAALDDEQREALAVLISQCYPERQGATMHAEHPPLSQREQGLNRALQEIARQRDEARAEVERMREGLRVLRCDMSEHEIDDPYVDSAMRDEWVQRIDTIRRLTHVGESGK